MSHPCRPNSVNVFDNFYSLTVYEKGSEVVRMYECLLGKAGFRKYSWHARLLLALNAFRGIWRGCERFSSFLAGKGMDLYFERHDGQAVRLFLDFALNKPKVFVVRNHVALLEADTALI